MSLKLPPVDKEKADKGFAFALKVCLATSVLAILLFIVGIFVPDLPLIGLLFAVCFFFVFLIWLFSIIFMLVIKLAVRCHEELNENELEQKTNPKPDIETNE